MECNLVVLCLIEKLVSDRFVERQSQEGIGLSASTAMSVLHTGHHLPWEHPQQDCIGQAGRHLVGRWRLT